MAQQDESGLQTVRLPMYGIEEMGTFHGADSSYYPQQLLVNCFPVIDKNPTSQDAGKVSLVTRPGFMFPNEYTMDFTAAFGGTALAVQTATPKAVLGLKGTGDYQIIIVAYEVLNSPNTEIRVVEYRPRTGNLTLLGTVTGYSLNSVEYAVHLTQIQHNQYVGFAMTIHPVAFTGSTAANSDAFFAWSTNLNSGGNWVGETGVALPGGWLPAQQSAFPTNTPAKGIVGAVVQLNNVHYIMTVDGYIHGSYPSLTGPTFYPQINVWNAAGYLAAQQAPDGGVGLVRYKHHILAFGQSSVEFFNDEGQAQPGLPIRRTQQAYFKTGMLNAQAYTTVDDELFFMGWSGDSGKINMYKVSGYSLQEVGGNNPALHLLNRSAYSAYLQCITMHGQRMLTTGVATRTPYDYIASDEDEKPGNVDLAGQLMYSIDTNTWWSLAFDHGYRNSNYSTVRLFVATIYTGSAPYQYVWLTLGSWSNAPFSYNFAIHPCELFYYYSQSNLIQYDEVRQENTASPSLVKWSWTIPVMYVSSVMDLGTSNKKTIYRMRVLTDWTYYNIGSGNALDDYGQSLTLSIYKDINAGCADGSSSPTPNITREFDIASQVGNPSMNMNNIGTCRKFQFAFNMNTWLQWRWTGVDLDVRASVH